MMSWLTCWRIVKPGTMPEVCIRAERREADVRLWLGDKGIGVEPRFHQRVFEVFEALYPQSGKGGTGIGLAIVKQGMQRKQGASGFESDPGVGSQFWIEMPAAG